MYHVGPPYIEKVQRNRGSTHAPYILFLTEISYGRSQHFDINTFYQVQRGARKVELTVQLVDALGNVVTGRGVSLSVECTTSDSKKGKVDATTGTWKETFKVSRAMPEVFFTIFC